MSENKQNALLAAKQKLGSGLMSTLDYISEINDYHKRLFDYPDFLYGTDVESISITPDGVIIRSLEHGIAMYMDAVDLHATPYALLGLGGYEANETAFLKSVFNDGDLFLDIGANLGWYSLVLGKHSPGGSIYAFEPVPGTVSRLEKNISLNQLNNVQALCLGLFNKEDELAFLVADDVSGATSLKMTGQERGAMPIREVLCKTSTLDNVCKQRGLVPTVMKIDVEGAELMVIEGALDTLKQRPIILMELLRKWSLVFGYHPNDVFALLASFGYRAWVFSSEHTGLLEPCHAVTDDTVQTNFVFMHPDRHSEVIARWQSGDDGR